MNKSCENYCIGGTSCDGCPNQYLDDRSLSITKSDVNGRKLFRISLTPRQDFDEIQKQRENKINKILE